MWELQQITINHWSDIDFKDFMNLYKKCTAKPHSSLVIDTTFASDNPWCQIIEQDKFTYSPLGKALEKQTKTSESQGEKQIKEIEDHEKQLVQSSNEKDSLTLLKQKETFDELNRERHDEMQNLTKQINYNNQTYFFKTKGSSPKYFLKYKFPLDFLRSLSDGETTMEEAEKTPKEFKSDLNSISIGMYKSQE